ncbi:hypothetical protein XM38_021620 [Halomicronema hongdechloris C2206]|uniref:Uncharacterized protein n=1 Tax=Halomicronema hongdechloris C2206 TaxID=1641165 RepID=A0A1Z3HLP2_9CYAN|nr:hypothetical protein XM38_021620 [Halomicronema hongdechloris C2206]
MSIAKLIVISLTTFNLGNQRLTPQKFQKAWPVVVISTALFAPISLHSIIVSP